jgi:glutamyl-tRNA synthetase
MQGQFIFRIEDTDQERSTKEAVDAILEGMRWLGLDWDEGPFYQTKRFARYEEITEQLLKEGKAYRCYCSKERLEKLREEQINTKQKPRYDGLCRERQDKPDMPFVIRFKTPLQGVIEIEDCVRGHVKIDNAELDDLVLIRSDGVPTYNFTVVIDDWDMNITHVIRGDDHLTNTPRQINIFKALGATPPIYAHVPMILGEDGKRLSKRHGAVSVLSYREEGFLPEALLNYLVRLGWSHGDQEIFSRAEMIALFDIHKLNIAPAALNYNKLLWLNQHYLKHLDPKEVAIQLEWHMQRKNIDVTKGPSLESIVVAQRERAKTLAEMAEKSRYFYQDTIEVNSIAATKHLTKELYDPLSMLLQELKNVPWEKELLHQTLLRVSEKCALSLGKLAQPLRVAVTGDTVSPPMDVTLELLGRPRVLARLESALDCIQKRAG